MRRYLPDRLLMGRAAHLSGLSKPYLSLLVVLFGGFDRNVGGIRDGARGRRLEEIALVKTTNRRRRESRRTTRHRVAAAPTAARDTVLMAVNADLDRTLARRGWILTERDRSGDVYDWGPSATPSNPEPTYLIVASDQVMDGLQPYRVRLVDGQRLTYDTAECLATDLDAIEARR